jgi:hypothetical protein
MVVTHEFWVQVIVVGMICCFETGNMMSLCKEFLSSFKC